MPRGESEAAALQNNHLATCRGSQPFGRHSWFLVIYLSFLSTCVQGSSPLSDGWTLYKFAEPRRQLLCCQQWVTRERQTHYEQQLLRAPGPEQLCQTTLTLHFGLWQSFVGFLTHSGVSGPVPTMPSSLYSLLVVPTYADAAHLLCTGKRSQISLHKTWLVRAFFILWCLSLFFLIPRQMKMKKYSHWAAFLWSLIHTSSCRELQIFLGQKRI